VLINDAKDKYYINYFAEKIGAKINVFNFDVSSPEIDDCLNLVLKILKLIDPIEIISGISVCLGLKKAKELNCNCISTGDGGDELFFGYDFLLDKKENYLNNWLKNVIRNAFFNSKPISQSFGINLLQPLYSKKVKEISIKTPLECKINYIDNKKYGKLLLRKFILMHGLKDIALRDKTPITSGSGADNLLNLWKKLTTIEEIKDLKEKYKIDFTSHAHAYLFKKGIQLGLFKDRSIAKENKCPICGSPMKNGFCRFCGAYISDGKISVYSDF
jgi:asparagine synthase (glutamine-hydrolysing)